MSIKVILFDVDGVLLQTPHYFSHELENQGYKNAIETLNNYYWGVHNQCLEGKQETEITIEPYLKDIGWKDGAIWYFQSQYAFDKKHINKDLFASIGKLREDGVLCYLWTDQEQIRAKILLEQFNFQEKFDGYFISCRLGSRKSGSLFWESVLQTLQDFNPSEIVFFDDVQTNVDKAKEFWIESRLFTDMEQFYRDVENLELRK